MIKNITELWFSWFYENWENYAPGDLLEKGLSPSQLAERFVDENDDKIIEIAKEFDSENYKALIEFMKLSESELLILKYFIKLIKLKNS